LSNKKKVLEENMMWIMRNMNSYGNSLIPVGMIKEIGIDGVRDELCNQLHRKVVINSYNSDARAYSSPVKTDKSTTDYIAEIIQ